MTVSWDQPLWIANWFSVPMGELILETKEYETKQYPVSKTNLKLSVDAPKNGTRYFSSVFSKGLLTGIYGKKI